MNHGDVMGICHGKSSNGDLNIQNAGLLEYYWNIIGIFMGNLPTNGGFNRNVNYSIMFETRIYLVCDSMILSHISMFCFIPKVLASIYIYNTYGGFLKWVISDHGLKYTK